MSRALYIGDCRELLPTLPAASVQCCVTSPPYWGLRDYGIEGQFGLEATPEEYLARMVEVFREVRRVLRDDGTCWVNMGDTYNSRLNGSHGGWNGSTPTPQRTMNDGADVEISAPGYKPKDLIGMPWRLAFALQADGWYLRADIIWAKPNPMPESVTDRPTKAHEYIFLLTKAARYFYDGEAIREAAEYGRSLDRDGEARGPWTASTARGECRGGSRSHSFAAGRNGRSVWTIPSAPYPEAHFATFPPELARRCIVAGTSAKGCCAECGAPWVREVQTIYVPHGPSARSGGDYAGERSAGTLTHGRFRPQEMKYGRATRVDTPVGWSPTCAHDAAPVPCTVLDPFAGSGTVGEVAEQNGRHVTLIELSPAYGDLIRERTVQLGLFAQNGHAVSLE
jgi:DNA modification methylase